ARQWNHQYVGTEHLLLGLADTDNGVLARLLGEHQVDAAQLRAAVEALVRADEPRQDALAKLPLTPRAQHALDLADADARFLQQDAVRPEHLLCGLVREPEGVAGQALRSLGLEPNQLAAGVYRERLAQMKFVERIARPVRAGVKRKRKVRDELLAHLTAVYEEELDRLRDPAAAMSAATERFGNPAELTAELESALPRSARREFYSEKWFGWRRGDSAARYLARSAAIVFVVLAVSLGLGGAAILWSNGWDSSAWIAIRPMLALVIITPLDVFAIGYLHFKLRDTIFGVFGARRSKWRELALGMSIAVVALVSWLFFVALAAWDLMAAKSMAIPLSVAGAGIALSAYITARWFGPIQIRDVMWELLELDLTDDRTSGRANGLDTSAEM
ncbi:MAG: Clp protease N-terminal domain-containing protein, partial [Pirellulales bacterium]